MRLPAWLHGLLRLARHLVASAQGLPPTVRSRPLPASGLIDPLGFTRTTPLVQPDETSCGSSVLVMVELLRDPSYAERVLGSPDPITEFAQAALAMRRRTNSLLDRHGRPQLPWPASLGTRPAALIRQLHGRYLNRVVDPLRPGPAFDAVVATLTAGHPVPLFIGEGSWMQHIVLITAASADELVIYDPACGEEVRRTRTDFEKLTLHVAGWDQPWLVILPR